MNGNDKRGGPMQMILNRRPPIDPGVASSMRTWVTRMFGVDCDFNRLSKDEALDALELFRKAWIQPSPDDETHSGGLNLGLLDADEKARFEHRIATAAGLEPGHFQTEREWHMLRVELARQNAEARRHRQMLRDETVDFLGVVHGHLLSGHLRFEHLGILVSLLAAFQAGETLGAPGQSFSGKGADLCLTFNTHYGLLGRVDPNGRAGNWQARLDHLIRTGWFTLERPGGPELRLRLGRRAVRAMAGEPLKSARAKARAEERKKAREQQAQLTTEAA
jgi:hypothetical protein